MRNTVLLAFIITAAYSQSVIGEGLSGQELWDYVIANYKTTTTLGYTKARDTLYAVIDLKDRNQLSCVYSGYTITLDSPTQNIGPQASSTIVIILPVTGS